MPQTENRKNYSPNKRPSPYPLLLPKRRCVKIPRPKTPPAMGKIKRPNTPQNFHTTNTLKRNQRGKEIRVEYEINKNESKAICKSNRESRIKTAERMNTDNHTE